MADAAYNRGKFLIGNSSLNWATDDIRVLLLDNADPYTFSPDHNFVADLTPATNELAGTGYVRKVLGSKAVTENDTNDRAELDAADVVWTGLNAGTAKAAVVFRQVTTDADSELLFYMDSGFPFTSNGGDLTWQVNAAGIATVS